MAFANNVLIVRRVLMAKLVELWKQDRLVEHIDRLPIELSPRNAKIMGRCCIQKELSGNINLFRCWALI